MREARLLGDMSEEPGVVQVLDYFEENNTAYIVMAYVSGSSLSEYFRKKGRIAPVQMFQILFPLMQTMDKVHKYGVIHRDISPENIKFTDDEEKEVRLIDFGSARDMMDNTHTIELTEGMPRRNSIPDTNRDRGQMFILCVQLRIRELQDKDRRVLCSEYHMMSC